MESAPGSIQTAIIGQLQQLCIKAESTGQTEAIDA
jgi:hypothetical protein